jgi:hypothetical protein
MSAGRAISTRPWRRKIFWRCAMFPFACASIAPALAAPPPGYLLSVGIYRPSTNHVYAYSDAGTKAFALDGAYGSGGDIPVVGDFDGNGVADLAVYRDGNWNIDTNHDYLSDKVVTFGGVAGDVPLAADFDGDGIADLVIYRSGTWLIRSSKTGQTSQRSLGGASADKPVVADFDGDGFMDIAIYRSGTWLIQTHAATGADIVDHFGGLAHYQPCALDWDHDGRADLCIYRDGIWRFKSLAGPDPIDAYAFGGPGDIPLSGVFDAAAIYVKAGAPTPRDGTAAHPFDTIGKGFDAAADGGVIRVGPGNYAENVVLYGPAVQYAPGKFGKNNLKLLGVHRRAVSLTPASGDAIVLEGSTGHLLEGFTIGSTTGRGVVLIGGPGSVSPSLPGSSMTIAFDRVAETLSYGVLITGGSHADIRYSQVDRSRTKSGVGMQSGAPSATFMYSEFAQNGYTPQSNVDGNGIEAQQSSTLTIIGNSIHDNNRFGIIGINDSNLDIEYNIIESNRSNGIIVCGAAANDTTTSKTVGNWIAGNGVDLGNGQGYNGLEIYGTCTGTHSVIGNTFINNSLNGLFVGSGTVTANNNAFDSNNNGITVYVDNNASSNTHLTVLGSAFTDNRGDGVFVQRAAGTTVRTLTATIGGTQPGAANSFTGSGLHGIGCATNTALLTCPSGGNTFSANNDDIESLCPATCVK